MKNFWLAGATKDGNQYPSKAFGAFVSLLHLPMHDRHFSLWRLFAIPTRYQTHNVLSYQVTCPRKTEEGRKVAPGYFIIKIFLTYVYIAHCDIDIFVVTRSPKAKGRQTASALCTGNLRVTSAFEPSAVQLNSVKILV